MISTATKISTPSNVYMASISDIHLAHPRTDTYHIIRNLRNAFPDDEETAKLDIIFFAGDVFDRLMNLPQDEVDAIQSWIADLLRICSKNDIIVRVLEGTPSHDWRQSKQFVNVNNTLDVPADLKYVDTLSIETIEKLGGLSVLYVPDEWNADASVTWKQVLELAAIHGMEKIDVACMHGSFDYQLPIESAKNHNSQNYMDLIRYFIVIGHVHIRTERGGKILAQGSFDRLSHGEEDAKGHYRAKITPEGKKHWFVENTGARIYKTLDCRNLTVDQSLELLAEYSDFPDKSNFRLKISRGGAVQHGLKDLRKAYPQFRINTQMDELKEQEKQVLVNDKVATIKPISITETNISHLVLERIKRQGGNEDDPKTIGILAVLDRYKTAN